MVALVAAVLVAGGCAGDPDPIVTETPTATPALSESPTPSPTPSPSATALTDEEVIALLPPDAHIGDIWGAQAFTRFFLLESQEMVRAQDSRLFEAISDPDCDFCNRRVDSLDTYVNGGTALEGGVLTILDSEPLVECTADWECHIEVEVDISEAEVVDDSGQTVESLPPERLHVAVEIVFNGTRWMAAGVGAEARE